MHTHNIDALQSKYTVITFAPVQGFIEKSRKLRDLHGASQILSYLSWKIVCAAQDNHCKVIAPVTVSEGERGMFSNADIVQGLPNRILILGEFSRSDAHKALMTGWKEIIAACREWLRTNLLQDFPELRDESGWANSWTRWKIHGWEIFWGSGTDIKSAMQDLETRKLRRGWTVPNWNGEISSLSGYDAIAYPMMDQAIESWRSRQDQKPKIDLFYEKLAEKLDPSGSENNRAYINENERLSIPELIKRLVTYPEVAELIDIGNQRIFELESFNQVIRKDEETGQTYWTGWFMGDGDRIGNYLKDLPDPDSVKKFSSCLRNWGSNFKSNFNLGRIVYAGGDDFLGIIYGTDDKPQRDKQEVFDWLCGLRSQWENLRADMRQSGLRVNEDGDDPDVTLSVGFVWAGHSVPQRDVLQHCREAEKLAKNLGRDRITIRIVFNNGQYVQWTTPWQYLEWLNDYRDRDGKIGKAANWNHVYNDLAQLKARHAIPPRHSTRQKEDIALEILKLYFQEDKGKKSSTVCKYRTKITGASDQRSVIAWIEDMIQVGWHLCSSI